MAAAAVALPEAPPTEVGVQGAWGAVCERAAPLRRIFLDGTCLCVGTCCCLAPDVVAPLPKFSRPKSPETLKPQPQQPPQPQPLQQQQQQQQQQQLQQQQQQPEPAAFNASPPTWLLPGGAGGGGGGIPGWLDALAAPLAPYMAQPLMTAHAAAAAAAGIMLNPDQPVALQPNPAYAAGLGLCSTAGSHGVGGHGGGAGGHHHYGGHGGGGGGFDCMLSQAPKPGAAGGGGAHLGISQHHPRRGRRRGGQGRGPTRGQTQQ